MNTGGIRVQRDGFSCAAIGMINLFNQLELEPPKFKTVKRALGTTMAGTKRRKYLPYLRSKGLKARFIRRPTLRDIKRFERNGYKIIVLMRGHFATLWKTTACGVSLTNSGTVETVKGMRRVCWIGNKRFMRNLRSIIVVRG